MKTLTLLSLAVFAFEEEYGANPIRKVVNLLQAMQKKVEEEGEKEEELYEKFVCYCKKNTGELTQSIADAQTKIAQLETQVKEDTASKDRVDEELRNHKQDRESAQNSLKAATQQRAKENEQYVKESGETGQNVEALKKAITAIRTGLAGGAFLQTQAGEVLKKLVISSRSLSDTDRESVSAFLSNSSAAPGSNEIVGILDEMKDEMARDLNGIVEAEEQAVKAFEALAAAKRKEIAAATNAIEQKTQRSGELAVKIVEGKNDLEDTIESLSEDEQFQVNLRKSCATKEQEVKERNKTRAEELQAIAETIKVLNDDDALDLFKKTLPSPGKSFLQQETSLKEVKEKAINIINSLKQTYKSPQLDFISLALKGKKVDFTKVVKMVDDLVEVLGEEQKEDDAHKEYCNKEFDTADDNKGAHKRRIESLTHDIEEASTASKNLADEIKVLQDGIAALDKSVAQATETRKSEHEEYVKTSQENQAALDLIAFAKNRLNKFYNPKQYQASPMRESHAEERAYENYGGEVEPTAAPGGLGVFLQVKHARNSAPPPMPPKTLEAYTDRSGESRGVIGLMDMLASDLQKDIQEAATEEKDSQKEYEEVLEDSQKKRSADSKLITTKAEAKAEADTVVQATNESLSSANQELYLTKQYVADLHKSCDFLMENFDFRKDARTQERDALIKAKTVLRGADFSLVETSSLLNTEGTPYNKCEELCKRMGTQPCKCSATEIDAASAHKGMDFPERADRALKESKAVLRGKTSLLNTVGTPYKECRELCRKMGTRPCQCSDAKIAGATAHKGMDFPERAGRTLREGKGVLGKKSTNE